MTIFKIFSTKYFGPVYPSLKSVIKLLISTVLIYTLERLKLHLMNPIKMRFLGLSLLFYFFLISAKAQIESGVYFSEYGNTIHELKISDDYLIHSVYEKKPAAFVRTVGGFYKVDENNLELALEFNSDFEINGVSELTIPYKVEDGNLILNADDNLIFEPRVTNDQDLDGQWLFATRGPDEGQERRGEANSRKTLKFLKDGRFQWIAYDTDGMQFKGTGGGSYTSKDGMYTENIEYFSRDNSRVGASLDFNYEVKGADWHHTGKNSKGEPLYEIWGRREK